MKIVIPGGAGHVGTFLAWDFAADGHEVVILSRNAGAASLSLESQGRVPCSHAARSSERRVSMPTSNGAQCATSRQSNALASRIVHWDGETPGAWTAEIDGADVVINLAGRSVNCRYGAKNRWEIMNSRVRSTRILGEAIAAAHSPPRVWLQASTATIYSHRYDAPNDELTGILGGMEANAPDTWRFSIDVARSWEDAANAAVVPHTRKVLLRSAFTLCPDRGGPFDFLLRLVRWGLGGAQGDGRQYTSWIHDRDFINAVRWVIDHPELDGPLNLAAPHPVTNAEFMRGLRAAWGIGWGLPATKWMLEIGVMLFRTESELILKSRRVVPTLLLNSGFGFQFPHWSEAAADLCRRWREDRRGAPHGAKLDRLTPAGA